MDVLRLIGTATGLGLLAGIRLYATVLALGLAIRFDLIELSPEFRGLEALADWWIIALAGVAFLVEFVADKVPWVDSMWDSIHTFIRPIGATLLALTALGEVSSTTQVLLALLTGGVALTGHSIKAATRLAVNQSPEPASNALLSLAGDAAIPVGVWLAVEHPFLVAAIVGVILLLFAWFAPRVFRLLRIQVSALRACVRSWFSSAETEPECEPLPDEFRTYAAREFGLTPVPSARRVVAGNGAGRLRNSIGYLILTEGHAVFLTRRWFRLRGFRLPLLEGSTPDFRHGFFMNRLTLRGVGGPLHFSVFKDVAFGGMAEAYPAASRG